MRLQDVVAHHAGGRPDKLAVIGGGRNLSFAALGARVIRLANALRGLGVTKGDRVAVLSTNRSEYIECVYAIAEAGAVWVPLNYRLAPSELGFIVGHAECKAVIFSDDLLGSVESLAELSPSVKVWVRIGDKGSFGIDYEDVLGRSRSTRPDCEVTPDDLVAIMYTSGTTGRPKGAMLSHRQMLNGMMYTAIASGASASDISLQVIPQFHAGGNIVQMAQIAVGATTVVAPRFDPELVLSLIEKESVSFVCFVPSMLIFLLESSNISRKKVSSLRRVMYGGSCIAPDRLSRALEIFDADFQQVYGQTEACVFATLMTGADHRAALEPRRQELLLSCGRGMLGYDVRIVDESGNDVSDGNLGELVCRGDSVMNGYWRQPEATAKTIRSGWLHTGDVAKRDRDGFFYIVDRKVDMIVSGGENVYPVEVENVISTHPNVLEVAVIGVPDETWGEAVKAIVVPRKGTNLVDTEIVAFCRGKIAGYKIPKSVELVESLPRTPSGKVTKTELRERYWTGRGRRVS